jgi:hypothetical protein
MTRWSDHLLAFLACWTSGQLAKASASHDAIDTIRPVRTVQAIPKIHKIRPRVDGRVP